MPKASFVIPVYDGDSYLAETIESIRNQTEKDIEIIVVNDCSPDFTDDLMQYYVKLDARIKYFPLEWNHGVVFARNFGNEQAQSPYILVSDQDDLSSPDRAEVSIAYLGSHPEVDCITSSYYETDVSGKPIQTFTPPHMTREVFESKNFVWFHSTACYRKKDILALPYRVVEGATDDWVFLDDWTKAGKKFVTLENVLGACRRLPWGQMAQRRKLMGLPENYTL